MGGTALPNVGLTDYEGLGPRWSGFVWVRSRIKEGRLPDYANSSHWEVMEDD